MADVFHTTLRPGDNHVIHEWEVADQAARLALVVTTGHIGKIAFQLDDASFWILRAATPSPNWERLGGGIAAPVTVPPDIAAASAIGSPGTYATATHTHGHGAQAGGTTHPEVTTTVAGFMSPADKSKLDGIAPGGGGPAAPVAAPPDVAASSALGTAGTYATANHTHGHGAQAGGPLHAVAGAAAGFMSAADKTKLDGIAAGAGVPPAAPGAAPPDIAAAGATGTAGTYATATHTHGHGNQGGGALHAVAGASAGFMSAADKAKLDGIPSGGGGPAAPASPPPDIAAAGATGTAGTYATATHTHGHGNQAGGALHANVVAGGAAGFMSGADKTKLDGIAAGATVAPAAPGGIPPDIGAVGFIGNPATYATGTHTHGHGNQGGGAQHTDAVASGASGFMSGADKAKLDGIPAGGGSPAAPASPPPAIAASGATGTAGTYATATHTHAHGDQAGGTLHAVAGAAAGFMSAADKTKLDGIATGATVGPAAPGAAPPEIAAASATGTAGTYATANHTHGHGAQALGTGNQHAVATTTVAGFMSGADKSKLDGITAGAGVPPAAPGAAPPNIAASSATGTVGTYATATHTHGHGDQAGGTLHATAVAGGAAGFMSGTDKTKLDGLSAPPAAPASPPPDIAAAGATGTAGTYATATHTHGHGAQAGGTTHAVATTGAAGFMSAADKSKLDGLSASGFTVVNWLTNTLTLDATHLDALIVWDGTANATLTIPSDAMASLPIGYCANLYHDGSGSYSIAINDANVTLESVRGCDSLDGLPQDGLATFVKIAANKWITNGTYGSSGPT